MNHSDRYLEVLASPGWKARAHHLKGWARGACEWCQSEADLDVHHLTYRSLGQEEPRELVVLCRSCHERSHIAEEPVWSQLLEIAERHPESFDELRRSEGIGATYFF